MLKSLNLTKANDAPQIDRSLYFTLRDSKTLFNEQLKTKRIQADGINEEKHNYEIRKHNKKRH